MIGTQRSGSNLLRLMLNQLKELSAPHPPHILERFMPLLPVYGDLAIAQNFAQLVDDVCQLVEYNPVPWTGVELNRDEIINRCNQPLLTEITRVIYELKAESENASAWMCKSMANIHYTDELESSGLKPLYLYLYRDGRDVACSFKKAIVGEKHIYHIAQQWKTEQDLSLQLIERVGQERVIQIRYEDLIANAEGEMRRLCAFIGISYDESAMQYHQSNEAKNTALSGAMWQNVEKPVIATNFNKYKKELQPEEIRLFEEVAGDTLLNLGYALDYPDQTVRKFAKDEIALFNAQNKQMKDDSRANQKPEDIEKRKNQDAFLKGLKHRFSQIESAATV